MAAVEDYLIDPDTLDWPKLLAGWRSILPFEFSIWLMNRFGDLTMVTSDEAVHRLDIAAGTLTKVAEDPGDYSRKIDEGSNAEDWLRHSLVDQLVASGLELGPGQCYGLRVAPVLGGGFTLDNIEVRAIPRQFAAFAPDTGSAASVVVDDTPLTIKVDYPPRSPAVGVPRVEESSGFKVNYGQTR